MSTNRSSSAGLIWIFAAVLATGLHAAGYAAWTLTRPPAEPDAFGAPAMEVALELTSPQEAPSETQPGPESEASAASAPVPEQKAEAEPNDLPKAEPTETDDPDRVAAPEPTKTPTEKTPEKVDTKANAAAESVASEATAPPVIEGARAAPKSAAPALGSGISATRVRATWQKELVAYLNRFKRYPTGAAQKTTTLTVTFTLDRAGHVLSAQVSNNAGGGAFEQAALEMMRKADPVPAPPPQVADEGLIFSLPVIFRAKRR